jgi:hypothetical protein
MILGISKIAVGEAFIPGEKLGLTIRRCSTLLRPHHPGDSQRRLNSGSEAHDGA